MSKPSVQIIDKYYLIWVVFVLAIAGFNLFAWLGRSPVADWDEARHGVTAYEMVKNGDFIVTTYLNNPDYWGLKPPLGIWLIAMAYKAFGYSVFSLRFFSAFFALLSVYFTMLIAKRHFGRSVSILSGIILSTTYGFVFVHSGRTGDWDSTLTFFAVLFIFFLDRSEEGNAYFSLAGLTVALAFLLKSFASIPLLVMAVVYVFAKKRSLSLKPRHYILFSTAVVFPVCLWAAARYSRDGFTFMKAMTGDLLDRSAHAIEGHAGGPAFYLSTMAWTFSPWTIVTCLFLAGLLGRAIYSLKDTTGLKGACYKIRSEAGRYFFKPTIIWIWFLIPLVLFSIAGTKLPWYINPVYPALAILSAVILAAAVSIGSPKSKRRFSPVHAILIIAILSAFAVAEMRISTHLIEESKRVDEGQYLLAHLPAKAVGPGARLYLTGHAAQSQVFVAEVLRNFKLDSLSREQFELLRKEAHSVAKVIRRFRFDLPGSDEFGYLKQSPHSITGVLRSFRLSSLSREEFDSLKKALDANNLLLIELETRKNVAPDRETLLKRVRAGDLVLIAKSRKNIDFLRKNGFSALRENGGWLIARKKGGARKQEILSPPFLDIVTQINYP